MNRDIFDAWMAVEIAFNSSKQWLIRVFCFMAGLTAGVLGTLALRG